MGRLHRVLLSGIAPLASGLVTGCPSAPPASPPPPVCSAPQGTAAQAQQLASDDTAFAVAFYPAAVTAVGAEQNVILSPYSVSATLTMVDTGAAGETDSQLRTVLNLPANGANVAPAFTALACADETDGTSPGNELSLANSLWGQEGKTFEPTFLSVLSQGYDAPMQQVDFAGDATSAESAINAWVSQETQGAIPDLLQAGDVSDMTRLVLVDAVYFKGTWQTGFDPAKTSSLPFQLSDGSMVSVPTMDSLVNLESGSVAGMSVYELPYKGALAMDFLVPAAGGTLPAIESTLTPASLAAALASLRPVAQAELLLPKFSFKTRLELSPVLAGMGMPDLFDVGTANLSGMDGAMDLSVSSVVHQATVEVDESGTVATAATSADPCNCSAVAEPPTIAIDQPFLFLIRDTKSESILFMGHVQNPQG